MRAEVFVERCSTMGHETVPATSRIALYDCGDDTCSGHPYCHECAEVLAADYDNTVLGEFDEVERLRALLGSAHAILDDLTTLYSATVRGGQYQQWRRAVAWLAEVNEQENAGA